MIDWNALGLGLSKAALAYYDTILKFKSDDREAWNDRGNALNDLGRFEEAM